jgi:hypothetical protein
MTTLSHFTMNGLEYYYTNNKYYKDNMTNRVEISSKEYRRALTDKLIIRNMSLEELKSSYGHFGQ